MAQLQQVVYLSQSDYQTLVNTGSLTKTVNNVTKTITYNQNAIYVTPETESITITDNITTGTAIATININGTSTTLYSPNVPSTIAVTQSVSAPTLEFVIGTNTSSSANLTGVLSTTTTIANGKIIFFLSPYALPAEQQTLTLTYANSATTTAAIPIYRYGSTRSVTPYPAGTVLILLYYNNAFYIVNNTLGVVN